MYGYIMFCLSIHQLIDTGLLSPFGPHEQLYYENLRTCFCANTCFISFDTRVEMLGQTTTLLDVLRNCDFFKVATPLYVFTSSV